MINIVSQSEHVYLVDPRSTENVNINDIVRNRNELFTICKLECLRSTHLKFSLYKEPGIHYPFNLYNVHSLLKFRNGGYLFDLRGANHIVVGGFYLRNKNKLETFTDIVTSHDHRIIVHDSVQLLLEFADSEGVVYGEPVVSKKIKLSPVVVNTGPTLKIFKCSRHFCAFSGGEEILIDTNSVSKLLVLVIIREGESIATVKIEANNNGQITARLPAIPACGNRCRVFLQLRRIDTAGYSDKLPFLYCHESFSNIMGLVFKQQQQTNTSPPSAADHDISADDQQSKVQEALVKFASSRSLKDLLFPFGHLLGGIDECGNTPLHLALIYGNLDIFQMLVSVNTRSDILVRNTGGLSPIELAIHFREFEYFQCLLNSPIQNVFYRDVNKNNLVHLTCLAGNLPIFQILLKHFSSDLKQFSPTIKSLVCGQNAWGLTPLHICIVESNYDAFFELTAHFNDILNYDARDNSENTILHRSACDPHFIRFTNILCRNPRVNKNVQTSDGLSPLHVAVINKNYIATLCLVVNGADKKSETTACMAKKYTSNPVCMVRCDPLRQLIENMFEPDNDITLTYKAINIVAAAYKNFVKPIDTCYCHLFSLTNCTLCSSRKGPYNCVYYAYEDPWMMDIFTKEKYDPIMLKKFCIYEEFKKVVYSKVSTQNELDSVGGKVEHIFKMPPNHFIF